MTTPMRCDYCDDPAIVTFWIQVSPTPGSPKISGCRAHYRQADEDAMKAHAERRRDDEDS